MKEQFPKNIGISKIEKNKQTENRITKERCYELPKPVQAEGRTNF